MSTALRVSALSAGYGRTEVLREVNITVEVGSVVALLGANGAGKTTLLKVISGLLPPSGGTVELYDRDVTRISPAQRTKHGLCHIPEGRGVFRSLTVRENLELQGDRGRGARLPLGRERLENVIDLAVQSFPILGERLNQVAGTLSGGQQQMLAVARAYIQHPKLVLVDEASLGLAPVIVDEIFSFLSAITERGASLLIVDQFVARALDMASHAYVMHRGAITFDGTAEELRDGDVFEQYLGTGAAAAAE